VELETMRRYPITRWSLIVLSALFVLAEALWILEGIRHPCEAGCVDASVLIALYFTFLVYALLLVPVALVALVLDSKRNRRKFGPWQLAPQPLPPRPDDAQDV
jgi:hypothetical protein